jgi:dolichyl-phosphate-mannose--protein O-mannosyl transferase
VGQGIALPDDFPKDVAIYPKAKVIASNKEKNGTMSVVLEITDSAQQVVTFYKEKLKENGWTIENETNMTGMAMLQGAKEGRKVALIAAGESGKTMTTLTLEKKAE